MRKRQSKEKDIRVSRHQPCSLCLPLPVVVLKLPLEHLAQRYYHLQVETYHFRAISNLLYDPYSLQSIQLTQMRKLMHCQQSLQRYYSFAQTTKTIRRVITHRVSKDFYGWVDFQSNHYHITNSYYLRRKQLVQTGRQMEKYLKNTSELQSTGSGDDKHVREYIRQRVKKQLDQQRLVLPNQTNSTIDIQKLTKSISVMVEKIADLSTLQSNKDSQMRKVSRQPTVFRFSNFRQISVIKLAQQVQLMVEPPNYQESYGLQTIKPKQNRTKKVNKLGLRSIDKLGLEEIRLPPATPSPRLVHRFQYIDNDESLKREKSKGKLAPLSPCSYSSSTKSNSKSKNKNKNRSSRRR